QQGWAKKWRANGWMRNKKDKALNPDLWGKLLDLLEEHQVTFHWVKGHAGHPENERCDQLAVAQSQKYAK
ncbi:MAG: RNase H family protein, partial [Massilioclostridium sp.]|nr:RNase H family protein [Massilioclostridium sp.]